MGRKRINQLLDQLNANHQADLQNAASIFTVAQVAIHQLEDQQTGSPSVNPYSLAPHSLDKNELKQQYGSYNACRNAAKQKGIRFKRTPTWDQLVVAFTYFETLQNLIQTYMAEHPNQHLQDVVMAFQID